MWRTLTDPVLRLFIGRDVFISYARDDAVRYAPALLRELRARGVSAFLDQIEAPPDDELPPQIRRALRLCSVLAIVIGGHAVASPYVAEEVSAFRRKPRPIVPILIDDVAGPEWIGKAVWESETQAAIDAATPKLTIVNRIADAAGVFTQARRLKLAVTVALLLLTVAGIAVNAARKRVDSASDEIAQRQIEAIQALRAERIAAAARDEADKARDLANDQKNAAEDARDLANDQKNAAEDARDLAAAEAKRQGEIANAIAETNEAETLLQREPASAARAAMLATDASRKLERLQVPGAAADSAVRNAFRLLPKIERPIAIDSRESDQIAISPDGDSIAVERDGRIEVIDTRRDHTETFSIADVPKDSMLALSFSADSHSLAALLVDDTRVLARVWKIGEGEKPRCTIELRATNVSAAVSAAIAISSDGALLATYLENVIRIWDTTTGDPLPQQLQEGTPRVQLVFSPNARYLAIGGSRLRVWEWRAQRDFRPEDVSFGGDASVRVAFRPDEKYLGFAADDKVGIVGLEKPFDGVRWLVRGMMSPKISFTPDGTRMLAVDPNQVVLYGAFDGKAQTSFTPGGLIGVANDDGRVVVGRRDRTVRLYDREGRELARAVHAGPVTNVAFRDASVVSMSNQAALIWRADGPNDPAWSSLGWWMARMVVSPDGASIIGFGFPQTDGLLTRKPTTLVVFDAVTGRVKSSIPAPGIFSMAFADARTLVASDTQKQLHGWTFDGERLTAGSPPAGLSTGQWIAAAGDGQALAISKDNTVVIRVRGGTEITLPHHRTICSIAFDPKTQRLVTGTIDGTVFVWDWRRDARTPLRRFSKVADLSAVLSHGDTIVAIGRDTTIWDLRRSTNEQIAVLRNGAKAMSASISRDGGVLAVATDDGQLRLWRNWTTDQPQEQARIWLGDAGTSLQLGFAGNAGQFLVSQHRKGLQSRLWRARDLRAAICAQLRGSVSEEERSRVCVN